MTSDSRYYLQGTARSALTGMMALLLTITAGLLMDCLKIQARYVDIVRHPYFDNGNARLGPFIAFSVGEFAACIGLFVALRAIWKLAFGPQVVLREQTFLGIRVTRKGGIAGARFHTGIHNLGRLIGIGEIRYDDVGSGSQKGKFSACVSSVSAADRIPGFRSTFHMRFQMRKNALLC